MPALRSIAWPLVAVLLAIGLRVAWIGHADVVPVSLMDTAFYDETARRVAAGHGYTGVEGAPTALFPPGYVFALAGTYRLFGAGVTVAQGSNVALSGGIVLLTYVVGRLTVGPRAALIAAFLWAIMPSQVIWSSLVMSEMSFTFVCLVALAFTLMAERAGCRLTCLSLVAGAGASAGTALLIRGQAIGLCVVVVAWLVLRRQARDRWLAAPLFVLIVAAVVAPWTIRNARQLDALVPISTTVGWNAAIGHSEHATGAFWSPLDVGLFGEHYFTPEPAREVAFHRAGLRLAWEWAREHPREELRLSVAKARVLWQGDDDAVSWQELGGAGSLGAWERVHLPRIVNGYYHAVLVLAGVGLAAGLVRRRPWAALALALVHTWTGFHLLFFAANRYHYPLLPLLTIAAGVGIQALGETAASLGTLIRPRGGTTIQLGFRAASAREAPPGNVATGGRWMSTRWTVTVRRWIRQRAAPLGTVALSVVATLWVTRGVAPLPATAQPGVPDEVRASAFVLVGADGTVLARLAPGSLGHGNLSLFDTAGKERVIVLGLGAVRVLDADGVTPRMGFGLNPQMGGGGFVVRDSAGRARLDLSVTSGDEFARLTVLDEQARSRVIAGMGPTGQGVQVRDADGQIVATLP